MSSKQAKIINISGPSPKEPLPVGRFLNSKEVKERIGKAIPFPALSDRIGETVILSLPRINGADYLVVKITSYCRGYDHYYKWDKEERILIDAGPYDRIGFSDNRKTEKENSWLCEMHYNTEKDDDRRFSSCMFEIK